MNKTFRFALAWGLLSGGSLLACTTFNVEKSTEKWMAKDYDWHLNFGLAMVNKHNVAKTSLPVLPTDKPATWKARYGSVTLNQYGRELPTEGVNEAGLAVETLWLDSSIYEPVDKRTTVNELQWVQYQLDNYGTVSELLQHLEDVRLSDVLAKVHYMACDRSGACATIEFISGKAAVHSGDNLPYHSLTNGTYDESLAYLKQFAGFGGTLAIPQTASSDDRFVRATSMVEGFPGALSSVDYVYSILASVSQTGENHTVWSSAYDLAEGRLFVQALTTGRKEIDLSGFDFSCKTPVKTYDAFQQAQGDVTTAFIDYTSAANQALVTQAFQEYQGQLPASVLAQIASYPESLPCQE